MTSSPSHERDSDAELDLLLGTVVDGKYRVDELIGRGGMGAVYRATNTSIGKRVALKLLYRESIRDRDAVLRFQREAEAASAVESAHIVEIFDSGGLDDGRPYLVMELLRGEDLRHRLRRERRISVPQAVHIGAQVTRALRRAHQAGIVHRDLKPDNVFLCARDDDPMFVKLVDFGISKVARTEATVDTLTRRGVVLGTAFYMSPEQAQAKRDVDGRSDLFSLGAILYESLTGEPPYQGPTYESVLIEICTKDAPDVRTLAPDVPEALARVIARALARDRDRRFASAAELHDALAAAVPSAMPASGVASEPVVPVSAGTLASAQTSYATAEGAAVAPGPRAAPPARRGLALAGAALIVGFGLTMLVFARVGRVAPASDLPSPPSAASGPRREASPSPSVSPSGSAPVLAVTPAPSISTVPMGSTLPARPVPSARLKPPEKKPGIASGLELATEP